MVGRDPTLIKKKLGLNNNEFVICPSREGCTLTTRITPSATSTKLQVTEPVTKTTVPEKDLVIVAVRVLVGSMPELIPNHVVIMGRTIKMEKSVKRWYDFPLTDEEVLLSQRNGFGECRIPVYDHFLHCSANHF